MARKAMLIDITLWKCRDYIVEPLSAIDCAGSSLRGFRVLPRSGRWQGTPPRRTQIEKEQLCLALT